MVLRSYRSDELPALLEATTTTNLDHVRPWLAWAWADTLEPALSGFVCQSVARFRGGEDFAYAIWDDATSLIVRKAPRMSVTPDTTGMRTWLTSDPLEQ